MIEKNSFKTLGEELERLHPPPSELEESIFNNLQIISLFGKSVEVFLPGAIGMFVEMLGGSSKLLDKEPELPDFLSEPTNTEDDGVPPGDSLID